MDAKELNKLWQSYQLRVTDEIAKSPEVLFWQIGRAHV